MDCRLIDGTAAEPYERLAIDIQGSYIAALDASLPGPPDETIDMSGLTVMPGLIDLHAHLGLIALENTTEVSPAMTAALMFENAELCLMSGHTTVRELGGADGALAQLIDAGIVKGPRLYPSGPMLVQSGGHDDLSPPYYPEIGNHLLAGTPGLSQLSVACDGPIEVRKAARDAFRRGATQLKVAISGGVVSQTDRLSHVQFSVEEMRVAVEEAEARETYVTAHAHNSRAVQIGLKAGIRCFEHASYLDEGTVARMAKAGAAIVPTLSIIRLLNTEFESYGVPASTRDRLDGVEEAMTSSLRLALDGGVLVGSGTDLFGPKQNRRGLEISLKASAVGAMNAIKSATSVNAQILRSPQLGVIGVGKAADIIGVAGDPLSDPRILEDPDRVVVVVKGGEVVKDSEGRAGS